MASSRRTPRIQPDARSDAIGAPRRAP
jgi:hypothetical protein